MSQLVAPFPYFGGKRNVVRMVWDRFGDVPNYVEPFFGSGAVLLGRPTESRTETVNDLDGLLVNAWCIWFSPSCSGPSEQRSLFGGGL